MSATQCSDSSSTGNEVPSTPHQLNPYAEESGRLLAEEGISDRSEISRRLIAFALDRRDFTTAKELRRSLKNAEAAANPTPKPKRTKAEIQAEAERKRQDRENLRIARQWEKISAKRKKLLAVGHEPLSLAQIHELLEPEDYRGYYRDDESRLANYVVGNRDLLPVVRPGDELTLQAVADVKTPLTPHSVAIVASRSTHFVGWVYINEDACGRLCVQKSLWRAGFESPLSNYEVLAICVGHKMGADGMCCALHVHEQHTERLMPWQQPNPMIWRGNRDESVGQYGLDIGVGRESRYIGNLDRALVPALLKFGTSSLWTVVSTVRDMEIKGQLWAHEADACTIEVVRSYAREAWWYTPEAIAGQERMAHRAKFGSYSEFVRRAASDNDFNHDVAEPLEAQLKSEVRTAYVGRLLRELLEPDLARMWESDPSRVAAFSESIVESFCNGPGVLRLSDSGPSGLLTPVNMVGL